MQMAVIENTDRYGIVVWGNGLAYSMFNKRTNRSIFLQGDDATTFAEELLGLLTMWQTEGSVYYGMSKDQVFAQLFGQYDHLPDACETFAETSDRLAGQAVH